MRIEVSGKQFVFPRQCVCCGRFPGTRLTISGSERNRNSRTRGWVWDVPYCQQCVAHVKAADWVLLGGLTIASLFGFCLLLSVFFGVAWQLSITWFAGSVASAITLSWTALIRIQKLKHPRCATVFRAIEYLGAAGPIHSFKFRSRPYAEEFVRRNRLKLVNASAMVSQVAKQVTVSENQVARRITKRLR